VGVTELNSDMRCQCLLDADLKLERLLIDNDEEVNIIIITLD